MKWQGLDLAPYLAYLPASLPVRVKGAILDMDVKVAFEQAPQLAVKLTGTVQTHNVHITDRGNQPLLSYERLTVDMADVRPLDHVVRLASVELAAPVVSAARQCGRRDQPRPTGHFSRFARAAGAGGGAQSR